MSRTLFDPQRLAPAERERFLRLTRAPRIAWPTVLMWAALTVTFIGVYAVCGLGWLPLWAGTLLNSVIGYVGFSVAHDAIHRAISTNTRLNDWIGQAGVLLLVPYVDLRLFRWGHIQHHRFASGERDPDRVFRGPWWSLPLRWMFIDLFYLRHALAHGDKISAPFLHNSLRMAAVFALVVAVLVAAGYGMEVLMLWFVPSRIVQLMLGFSFFWLPHVPHDVSQEENFTRATTIREGYEAVLGPLLQYQHYHLVHHLFPATPFYNNYRVWLLIEAQMRQHELAVQHGLAIHPTIHPGAVS